jgi:hypothetical protein
LPLLASRINDRCRRAHGRKTAGFLGHLRQNAVLSLLAHEIGGARAGEGQRPHGRIGELAGEFGRPAPVVHQPLLDGLVAAEHACVDPGRIARHQDRVFRLHGGVGLGRENANETLGCIFHGHIATTAPVDTSVVLISIQVQ